jgi:hypothetical protein
MADSLGAFWIRRVINHRGTETQRRRRMGRTVGKKNAKEEEEDIRGRKNRMRREERRIEIGEKERNSRKMESKNCFSRKWNSSSRILIQRVFIFKYYSCEGLCVSFLLAFLLLLSFFLPYSSSIFPCLLCDSVSLW